jgi:hypothetical protein
MMWEQSGLWGLSIICAVFMLIGSILTRKYLSTSSVQPARPVPGTGK